MSPISVCFVKANKDIAAVAINKIDLQMLHFDAVTSIDSGGTVDISAGSRVDIACKRKGFAVADGVEMLIMVRGVDGDIHRDNTIAIIDGEQAVGIYRRRPENGIKIVESRRGAPIAVDKSVVRASHTQVETIDAVAAIYGCKGVDIVASNGIVEAEESIGASVTDAANQAGVEGGMYSQEDKSRHDAVGTVFGTDGIEPRRNVDRVAQSEGVTFTYFGKNRVVFDARAKHQDGSRRVVATGPIGQQGR